MKNRFLRVFMSHSLPLLVVSVLLGGGAIIITNAFMVQAVEKQTYNQLGQIQSYYEVILGEMDALNLMFSTNTEMITRLQRLLDAERWDWIDSNDSRLIRSVISAHANARPYIDSIYVYLYNGMDRVLTSQNGIMSITTMDDRSWYSSFMQNAGHDIFRAEYTVITNDRAAPPKRIIRISRTIYNTQSNPLGVIVLNLLTDRLADDYPSAIDDSVLTIYNTNGNVLLSTADNSALSPDFVRFSSISPRFNWDYELSIPRNYLYRLPRIMGLLTVVLSILVCILGLFLTYKTNRKERTFLRIQKEVMEYRALQMQINPHFLYNTLETINWKAVSLLAGPNDISRMIQLLSRLLKYSIEISAAPGVPLGEEILHTRDYLELQKYRFADGFSVEWRIAEGLENFPVPRLVLQPILENSFTHGFRGNDQPLKITIDIHREDDTVVFMVEDNGEGIGQKTLEWLNDYSASADFPPGSPDNKGVIGFANIRKRIFLFYGDRVNISVTSREKEGTRVRIQAPWAFNPTLSIPQ